MNDQEPYEGFWEELDRAFAQLSPREQEEIMLALWAETSLRPAAESAPEAAALPVPEARGRIEAYEWVRAVVVAIVFVGVLSLFFVRIVGVAGESMEPTLEDGQRLLVSNLFYRPSPGDIIIFSEKGYFENIEYMRGSEPLIKRVIAVAGQDINIDFLTGEVWVNQILLSEPYILEATHRSGDLTFPLTVPPGFLFVMGDNRNDSLDSRFEQIGLVDERYVLGRVLLRVWPPGRFGLVAA